MVNLQAARSLLRSRRERDRHLEFDSAYRHILARHRAFASDTDTQNTDLASTGYLVAGFRGHSYVKLDEVNKVVSDCGEVLAFRSVVGLDPDTPRG